MKKGFALLLCFVLLLPSFAMAEVYSPVDYTMDRKVISQIRTGGYEGTVTVSAEGDGMGYPFETLFSVFSPLRQAQIRVDGTGEKNIGTHNDCRITAEREGAPLFDLRLQYAPDLAVLSSETLLGEKRLAFDPASFSDMLLDLYAIPAELRAFFTARERALPPALTDYEEEFGLFLAEHCTVGVEDGCSVLTYTVAPETLVRECASLLSLLMKDTPARDALRSLLQGTGLEVLFTAENAALLPQAVRMLTLNGDLVIVRRFDASARESDTYAELPMVTGSDLSRIIVRVTPGEGETCLDVTAVYQQDDLVRFSCLKEQNTYTGVFETRSAAHGLNEGFDYTLILTEKNVNYDRVEDKVSQRFGLMLTLVPLQGSASHAFTAEGELTLTSKKAENAASFLSGTFALVDETAGSMLSFDLSGRTKVAAVPQIADPSTAFRADQMPVPELEQWLLQVLQAYEDVLPPL